MNDMTEVTRAEFEEMRLEVKKNSQAIARHDTQYAVINTKLSAILWLLGVSGSAAVALIVRYVLGGVL